MRERWLFHRSQAAQASRRAGLRCCLRCRSVRFPKLFATQILLLRRNKRKQPLPRSPRAHDMAVGCRSGRAPTPPKVRLLAGSASPLPGLSPASRHVGAALGRGLWRLAERHRASPAAHQDTSPKGEGGSGQPPRYPGQGRQPSPPGSQRLAVQMCTDVGNTCRGGSGGSNEDVGAAPDTSPGHALHKPEPSLLPLRLGTASVRRRRQAGFWSGKGSVIHYLCPRTGTMVINIFFESCG